MSFIYEKGYFTDLSHFTAVTNLDSHSIEKPVFFVNDTNLHLSGTSLGDPDLRGIPIEGITDDIDGNPRNISRPYMGADEADVPLPVLLTSFTSTVVRNNVTLNWSTLAEQNNSGFEIQRRIAGGSDWIISGHVAGNGTTTTLSNYSFTERVATGSWYYRLKQIDFNGNFAYYDLLNKVIIGVPFNYTLKQNYPNPFNPSTKIDYVLSDDSRISIKLYDVSGKEVSVLINKEQTAGFYTLDFNAQDLSAGVYFYKMEASPLSSSAEEMESDIYTEIRRMVLLK